MVSIGFGQLQTNCSVYMELRKDEVRLRKDKEESLNFLQKMASAHKMDINMAVKNAILSSQSQYQAEQARLPWPTGRQNSRMILSSTI